MSSRGRNPSRPSNTGFKVVPAHAPHSAYLGKAKKLKESLIERARIKKSFAKALKKEGLQSERLGRGQDSGPGQGYGGNDPARGSSFRGRGSGRGGGNVGGRPGGRGGSRSSVIKQDGIRELVQLSRKTKSDGGSSTPKTAAGSGSTATKTSIKRTAVPESESDESELESGEERAPRPSKKQDAGNNLAPNENEDEDEDDGFFDGDDDDLEGDMIDSRVSLRGNKGKGKGRADRVDQDGTTSMSEDEDEGNDMKRSRERSRAGPPPGDDDQDGDDEEAFLPYTRSNSNPSLRGRPGSTRGTSTSTSSRGRNHLQGSNQGAYPTSSSSTSTPVYGAGRPRPWGTDGVAYMSLPGSGSMGTVTRPKGKKDKGNPNFTFLGRMGDDAGNADRGERDARAGGRTGTKDRMEQELPPKAVVVNNTPFRGKPLHSHKPPGSTPSSTDPNSTTTDNNNPRSTLTLRDLKRTAYLGPAKTSSSSVSSGPVHPGRTKRTSQKQQQHQQQPGGRTGIAGGRRNASGVGGGGGGSARQPRLGARMGALLQEIERRG